MSVTQRDRATQEVLGDSSPWVLPGLQLAIDLPLALLLRPFLPYTQTPTILNKLQCIASVNLLSVREQTKREGVVPVGYHPLP